MVFVHRALVPEISDLQSSVVACGLSLIGATQMGNKGAVGISFNLQHHSYLFLSCHFAASQVCGAVVQLCSCAVVQLCADCSQRIVCGSSLLELRALLLGGGGGGSDVRVAVWPFCSFAFEHLAFELLAFGIRHLAFGIWHLACVHVCICAFGIFGLRNCTAS